MFISLVAANLNVIFLTPRKHFIIHSTLFLAVWVVKPLNKLFFT